jgi:DNA-directed RNA polymerase subunit RPC12/RpoP
MGYARKNGWFGYDPKSDTIRCDNCGGQTMMHTCSGKTFARADGTPCLHEYVGLSDPHETMRGWHKYRCKHCPDYYEIDSGD